MKHILRTTSIGTAFILILTCSTLATADNSQSESDKAYLADGVEIPTEMLLQEEALNAYETLYSTFDIDENYNYVLPDDYAGEYINDDYKLVVQLTTDDYSVYEAILSDYDCVVFQTVEYSYNELYELADTTRTTISEDMNNISYVSSGVDVKDNVAQVEVGVYHLAEDTAFTASLSNDIPLEIKYITVEPTTDIYYYATMANSANTLSSQSNELIGGNRIRSAANSGVTIAICGTHNGNNAILSTGHAFSIGTQIIHNSRYIGQVVFNRYSNNQYGDFCIIDLDNPGNGTPTNKVKHNINTVSITSSVYSVPAGTLCHKYGQQSGYATVTTLGTEDVTYTDEDHNSITIKGLISATLESGASQGGDSGGPYYIYQNGNWTFCGVHSGYAATNPPEVYFTPYLHIYGTFTVKTS